MNFKKIVHIIIAIILLAILFVINLNKSTIGFGWEMFSLLNIITVALIFIIGISAVEYFKKKYKNKK